MGAKHLETRREEPLTNAGLGVVVLLGILSDTLLTGVWRVRVDFPEGV